MSPEEDHIIYGVDITKKVTPLMVRDAIIDCFYKAHGDILDLAWEYFGCDSKKKFETMKQTHVEELIETIFTRVGGDVNKPTKEALIQVVTNLKKIAALYREPEVIEKHTGEIMLLIDKLD